MRRINVVSSRPGSTFGTTKSMTAQDHVPVLREEVLAALLPEAARSSRPVIVDCTLGRGGHASDLAAAAPGARVIGFDLDEANLSAAAQRLRDEGADVTPVHGSFLTAPRELARLGCRADVVLADLGFSSNQMDEPSRGFSMQAEGPLDMRLDRRQPVTAASLVATLGEAELADLIRRYGEDPLATKIARIVVRERQIKPIENTTQLARLVRIAYGARART